MIPSGHVVDFKHNEPPYCLTHNKTPHFTVFFTASDQHRLQQNDINIIVKMAGNDKNLFYDWRSNIIKWV